MELTRGPVLIVDDTHYRLLSKELELEGILALGYGRGIPAIEDIQNGLKYRVALIDASLPDISGSEVIAASKVHNPAAFIIGYTGWSDLVLYGADRMIVKDSEEDDDIIEILKTYI